MACTRCRGPWPSATPAGRARQVGTGRHSDCAARRRRRRSLPTLGTAAGLMAIGATGYGLSLCFCLLAQRAFGAVRTGSKSQLRQRAPPRRQKVQPACKPRPVTPFAHMLARPPTAAPRQYTMDKESFVIARPGRCLGGRRRCRVRIAIAWSLCAVCSCSPPACCREVGRGEDWCLPARTTRCRPTFDV